MGTPAKLNTERPSLHVQLARGVRCRSNRRAGAAKSRARPVVFEFARPARDEHHAPRVEHHEYKLKNEHELEHSAAADRDMNSSSARLPTLLSGGGGKSNNAHAPAAGCAGRA